MSATLKKENEYKMTPGIFEVESILQRGRSGNEIFYLIKWKGYSEQEATWEPESNLTGCREAILEFQSIIKQMEEQKQTPQQSATKTKRKPRKDKEKHFLTSQSKELSQEQEPKNPNVQSKPQVERLAPSKQDLKKEQKNQPQKLETSMNSQSKQNLNSSSQNNILESTTALTILSKIQENRLRTHGHPLEKSQQNESEKLKIVNFSKKSQLQKIHPSLKLENHSSSSNSQKSKKQVFQRQREKPQASSIKTQRITKKNKLSTPEKEQKKTISHQVPQIKQHKPEMDKNDHKKSEKPQPSQTKQLKNKPFQIINQVAQKIKQENTVIKYPSQRSLLCDQEFQQLTAEMFGCIDPRLKRSLKFEQDEKSIGDLKNSMKKFINLSTPQFASITEKIKEIILSKQEVEKLDNQGEFLYCNIEILIKINESGNDDKKYSWISVMKNYQTGEQEKNENCYFVDIDDLKSQTWKKKFRKFLVSKQ